jgi:hypothetical protein
MKLLWMQEITFFSIYPSIQANVALSIYSLLPQADLRRKACSSVLDFEFGKVHFLKWVHGSSTHQVLLPGFQKGRDIKASQGKGQGAVLVKKGQFAS